MQFQINLEDDILKQAVSVQIVKGEFGEKVAEKIAEFQAEIMTFNRTEVAQLMNKSRPTIYELEKAGKLKFHNGTISLKELRDFRRAEVEATEIVVETAERRPAQMIKRRSLR